MPGGFGPVLGKPTTLSLRYRCSAQRILARQTTPLQARLEIGKRLALTLVAKMFGKLARQAHHKPQPVLKVADFRISHDPGPIESRIP